ncbi:alkyl sulfatase BDS1-like metallo-beta-lactamase superfamily hydrolase [Pseudomonas sp. WPR_5_2]|uniref:alkyl/aryl-sulfatase n=1 Tax=Pseudomonas sp. WPR_5_2 TaxID=1907371 RepID=UPI000EB25C7E|nr:alkyl sulfatase dimerization domain-containing protein [Pseudomonas sp. WPR_5_2]RKS27315.1 alkyl sulfatase BDS1-like metallo-beta-lactamase superfamily hydrolase [Pseudomonas sp. WPR_5_2]
MRYSLVALAIAIALSSGPTWATDAVNPAKAASTTTAAVNKDVLKQLPFQDRADYEAARRGLVAAFEGEVKDAEGKTVWNSHQYDFLKQDQAPDSVNPSLWRMAQLNTNAGLFQVTDKIYQIRGMDLANMTIIEGDEGLIIIDPLYVTETAKAGLELYYQNRPRKPVVAVIYSHSHVDHFGGVRGVVDEADIKAGKVRIYAPEGFMEHAIQENVLAGAAMFRRGMYQSGGAVPNNALGQVDTGIGKGAPTGGTISLIAPTNLVAQAEETHDIAGVQFVFQLTPGTEAPSEMNVYLPQMQALCISENATKTMHNLLTPRGAEVRDGKAWAQFLDDALVRYGDKAQVMFAQHNWPTWGGENIRTLLADERDMYAFVNNRTLNLLNQGLTPLEIADAVKKLPGELDRKWYARGYYGTLSFNTRAVYQRYLGFYDGNPSNLDPLPPVEAGKHYVQAMGGADKVLAQMHAAMDKGDYRWAAQLGNHLVFAEPDNKAAREAQADTLEQLAYQSESAIWRNMYLTGAQELRQIKPQQGARVTADLIRAATPTMFMDLLAVRMDSDKAQGHDMTLNWNFDDLDQHFALTLRNGVLTYREHASHAQPVASVTMSKAVLDKISLRQLDFPTALKQGDIKLEGDGERFKAMLGMLTSFQPTFNVVTP